MDDSDVIGSIIMFAAACVVVAFFGLALVDGALWLLR